MNREKEIIKTSFIGIIANVLLVAGKIVIGLLAKSVSIITDAINNLTDALSSLITIIGTKLAGKKPDKEHPYGHGRVEYLTSTLIAFLILFAGGSAIVESISSLIEGTKPTYDYWAIIIVSMAVLVKVVLGLFFKRQGKKVESDALVSSGTDALFDSILSLGTLLAAGVSMLWGFHIEGYLAIVIGIFIIKSGIEVLKESVSKIIGKRFDSEKSSEIKRFIMDKHEEVKGVYDLIVNNYGPNKLIASAHIEVDDSLTAKELQYIERSIQGEVYENFGIIISIGIYASNSSTEFSKNMKSFITELVKNENSITQLHGFYVDEIKKLIVFDIIIDFAEKSPISVKERLVDKIKEKYPDYKINVVIDSDFSD